MIRKGRAFEVIKTIDDKFKKGTIWYCIKYMSTTDRAIFVKYKQDKQRLPLKIGGKNSVSFLGEKLQSLVRDGNISFIQ